MDTVLHTEIADFGPFGLLLLIHVGFELRIGVVHLGQEGLILLQVNQTRVVQFVEKIDRVLFAGYPQIIIDVFPNFVCLGVPRPPKVFRKFFKRV